MATATHITANMVVQGTLRAAGDLVIAGRVLGRIESESLVVVEAGGIIEADVHAHSVLVRGVIVGNVDAVDGIEVAATGQVVGDVRTRRVRLVAGGRVSGGMTTGMEIQPYTFSERGAAGAQSRGMAANRSRGFGESGFGSTPSPAPRREPWPTPAADAIRPTPPARNEPWPKADAPTPAGGDSATRKGFDANAFLKSLGIDENAAATEVVEASGPDAEPNDDAPERRDEKA